MKWAYRPLKDWHVNQVFGANQVCVDILTNSKYIGCDGKNPPAGYRSVYGPQGHLGLDLFAPRWTPFYACEGGTVVGKVMDERRGWGVEILHPVNGKYFLSRYWHLCAIDVDLGDEVGVGDFLGYCDNTGISTSDHLHFEIGECDSSGSNYVPKNPELYLFPAFALNAKSLFARIREQLAAISDKLADYIRYGKFS